MTTSVPPLPTKAAAIGLLLDKDGPVLPFKAVIGYSTDFRPAYISVYLIRPESFHVFVVKLSVKSSSMADRRKKGKELYGTGKAQRRRQLQLARSSRGQASESESLPADGGEGSASSETMAAAAEV